MSSAITAEKRLVHLEGQYQDRVTVFRRKLLQHDPQRVLLVLLDMGKNVHWLTVRTAASEVLFPSTKLTTTQKGYRQCTQAIDYWVAERQAAWVIIAHEPTGVYHEPWAYAFQERYAAQLKGKRQPKFEHWFFNPYQVKLARKQKHLRPHKNDPLDLAAMEDLALRGLGQPAYFPEGNALLIRQEVGFVRAQRKLLRTLQRQLLQQVDRVWPGAFVNLSTFRKAHPELSEPKPLVQTRPLSRDRLRVLLAHCPSPYALMEMSDTELMALYRCHTGRAGPSLVKKLRIWSQNAIILPENVVIPLAEQLQRQFEQYLRTETLVEEGLARLTTLVPHTSARHLVGIPGLGERDAAQYLAGVGSIERFHKDSQVWAFAGFDPIQDGSGDRPERIGHISKHGDPGFRDSLYQMGYRTALHYPPVGLTFLNAYQRSKSEVAATLHAAHKVNRIGFHLVKHNEPFIAQTRPEQRTEYQKRLAQFRDAKRKKQHKPRKRRTRRRRR